MANLLVVDDSEVDRRLVGGLLMTDEDLNVEFAVDGRDALERIERSLPDLVITDLIMPNMNGLELVGELRDKHRGLPVIVMTSSGSEEIAVEALQQGASSYVPKRLIDRYLLTTVQRLLTVVNEQRQRRRLMGCMTTNECSFELENDSTLIRTLVAYIQENLMHMGMFDEMDLLRISVALEESLLNALYHGNLGIGSELRGEDDEAHQALIDKRLTEPPFCQRHIFLEAKLTAFQAMFVVRDEGHGFDSGSLPDPTEPENIELASGRGVLLMRSFMDEVMFNEIGNEVTMVKRSRILPETGGQS